MKVSLLLSAVLCHALVSGDIIRWSNGRYYSHNPRRARQLQVEQQGFVHEPELSIPFDAYGQNRLQAETEPRNGPGNETPIEQPPSLEEQFAITGDQLNGDQLNGDQLNGDQLNGDQLNGDQLNGDQLPVEPVPQTQLSVDEALQPVPVQPEDVPFQTEDAPVQPVTVPVQTEDAPVQPAGIPVQPAGIPVQPVEEVPVEVSEPRILIGAPQSAEQLPIQPAAQPVQPLEQVAVRQEDLDPIKAGVDFSACVIEPDTGLCCVETLESVTSLQKEPYLECTHKNVEKCHYTYVTQFETSQEEVCEENFEKSCQITFKQQAFNETVKKCYKPLEKICDGQGPEECRTVYESSCTTKYIEKQPGKFVGETACEKLPIEICGAGCSIVEAPEECHDKTLTSLIDVPEEVCDLNPQKTCRFQTKLVPKLKPEPECTIIPKETCNLRFDNPQQIEKPLKTKWCLDLSPPTPDNTYDEGNARAPPIGSASENIPTFEPQPFYNIQRGPNQVVQNDAPFTAPSGFAYYRRF